MANFSMIFAHSHQPPMRGLWPYELPPTEAGESTKDGRFGPIDVRYGKYTGSVVANHTDQVSGECYIPNLQNLESMATGWTPSLLMQLGDHLCEHNRRVFEGLREIGSQRKGQIVAELFSHPIAPFLSDENLAIQLDWGLRFYEYFSGHAAKTMWFAEAAIDKRVLTEAAKRGIENTILAEWQVNGVTDIFKPCRVDLNEGKSINVFVYHPASGCYSFDEWFTMNADEFLQRQLGLFGGAAGDNLMIVASDLEFYNHHKKDRHLFAEAYFRLLRERSQLQLVTDLEGYAEAHKPNVTAGLNENTAWSINHRTEDWSKGGEGNWKPYVMEAIERYDGAFWIGFYEKGKKIFQDPLRAATDYIRLILDPENIGPLQAEMIERPTRKNLDAAMYLLDAVVFLQFMHTSCALFFEKPGLETEGAFKAVYFSLLSLARSGLCTSAELKLLENTFLGPLHESQKGIIPGSRSFADDYARMVSYHQSFAASPIEQPAYYQRTCLHFPQLFGFTRDIL